MPVIYDDTVKAARLTATRDIFAEGTIEIQAANDAVLAIFTLSETGGDVSDDVWTLTFGAGSDAGQTVQGETAASTGTNATKARIKTEGGTARLTGLTVGVGSGDIQLNNVSIADGQDVSLTAATITHAPDPS